MVQWYPGHMAKATRLIRERLKQVDVVFELLDARIPSSSRNPQIDAIIGPKPRLVIFNKADLADPEATKAWMAWFAQAKQPVLPLDAVSGAGVAKIVPQCEVLLREKRQAWQKKGVKPPPIRAMILGIPNVGKSTLINRLLSRKAAKTGNRPGVTQQQQWFSVQGKLQLLDTPGVLWPKFEDADVGYRLAVTGAIKDEILDVTEVALYALRLLRERYASLLFQRYRLPEEDAEPLAWLEAIGRQRGCLMSGGAVDFEKAAAIFLHDLRTGKIGRITLEWPPAHGDVHEGEEKVHGVV